MTDKKAKKAEAPKEPKEIPIFEIPEPKELPDKYVEQKVADDKGGVGAQYKLPIKSYSEFRASVIGKGFDVDEHYGWQCWDGTALLWQQLGKWLITGNGLAIGCWDLKRNVNKYDQFDLVTDVNKLELGDVVVMRPNHIGFFDGMAGDYMKIVGQNQGGSPKHKDGGSAFNVARIRKTSFAGAFRYKAWASKTSTPAAPAASTATAKTYKVVKGDTLSEIGAALKMDWKEIAKINGIKAPYIIKPNQVLKLTGSAPAAAPTSPSTYTVISGDYLRKVARKTGTSWKELARINGIENPYIIRPGQKLKLK